jgi:RHS repeat-associated protein
VIPHKKQLFGGRRRIVKSWHRFYDPTTGRYTAEDPIGFAGGDFNLYAYVWNDPVRFIDPWGLAIGDPPPRYPPGYDPGTWVVDGEGYWDPSGNHWTPHNEDEGHWAHWDKQKPDGKKERYPKKSKKPWPNQKKPPYGDQSAEPPDYAEDWGDKSVGECDEDCQEFTIGIGFLLFLIYNICTGGAGS